jgi:hypothetical protein
VLKRYTSLQQNLQSILPLRQLAKASAGIGGVLVFRQPRYLDLTLQGFQCIAKVDPNKG